MPDIKTWWAEIPIITRWGLALMLGTTIGAGVGILPAMYLTFWPARILKNLEVWRLLTCYFYFGKLSLNFLMSAVFWYRHSGSIETSIFDGRTADYLWMILFGMMVMWIPSFFLNFPIAGSGIVMMVIYYWSRRNPDAVVTFMFGLKFEARYLPWVLMGFTLLTGGLPIVDFFGALTGHLYLFLETVLPATHGLTLLKTPTILYSLFPPTLNRNAPGARNVARPVAHPWGPGRALGGG